MTKYKKRLLAAKLSLLVLAWDMWIYLSQKPEFPYETVQFRESWTDTNSLHFYYSIEDTIQDK